MRDLKVLAINSLPVHGMAGLKASMNILGHRVLPVPSVILNGLTNMPHVQKQFLNFKELLAGTCKLIAHRNQKVILYIGYLGSPDQIDVILEIIKIFREYIHTIITDPVGGDHGKAYVAKEIVSRWPELIKISNLVFPNLTELKLMIGADPAESKTMAECLRAYEALYPDVGLVVTSYKPNDGEIGILFRQGSSTFEYTHGILAKFYGGSGDAFIAFFILFHFYHGLSINSALQKAADLVTESIVFSMEMESDELLIKQSVMGVSYEQ